MASVLQRWIPGWIILLLAVAVFELTVNKRRKMRKTLVASTFTDEFTAMFYGTKRRELDHRASVSMLRDDQADGAPPFGLDLAGGKVTLDRINHPNTEAESGADEEQPCATA